MNMNRKRKRKDMKENNMQGNERKGLNESKYIFHTKFKNLTCELVTGKMCKKTDLKTNDRKKSGSPKVGQLYLTLITTPLLITSEHEMNVRHTSGIDGQIDRLQLRMLMAGGGALFLSRIRLSKFEAAKQGDTCFSCNTSAYLSLRMADCRVVVDRGGFTFLSLMVLCFLP